MINNGDTEYDQMKKFIGLMRKYNNQPKPELINENYGFNNEQQSILREDERELTDEELQQEKELFESSVSSPVEYDEFRLYGDNVEWSGKLIKENISWTYSLDDQEAIYVTIEQLQLTDGVMETLQNLKSYWLEWSEKWSQEIST